MLSSTELLMNNLRFSIIIILLLTLIAWKSIELSQSPIPTEHFGGGGSGLHEEEVDDQSNVYPLGFECDDGNMGRALEQLNKKTRQAESQLKHRKSFPDQRARRSNSFEGSIGGTPYRYRGDGPHFAYPVRHLRPFL
ncbi:hypothetical protein BCR34DRAFT_608891 [Clohesyomyces aquaticus]|uniref:Uncharacterized protein n=1 Tax=Clohesyomyces aquaticus TaxID=1231657 RepID=A0A1Y1Y227_9PLEO|nr:hypothetical protein BCR34DRAFT_608891 [Clohesyomyces aquaticus]